MDRIPGLVDSHCHLQDSLFQEQMEEVLQRAFHAGVVRWVVNGSEEKDWPAVYQLAKQYPQIVPCFGLHPWYIANRSPDWLSTLESCLREIPSGLGEIGLDRWREDLEETDQKEVFIRQLDLARRLQRPVMIHCLRAWGWLEEILRRENPLPAGFLIHAYSGSPELIPFFASCGARFSFAGNVLDQKRTRMQRSLLAVPRHLLLLESDAPDLPLPGSWHPSFPIVGGSPDLHSEPAHVEILFRQVAQRRQEDPMLLAEALWENSQQLLFPILQRENMPGPKSISGE